MTTEEKTLYHQIHPVKLLTDWITGLASLYFFWRHQLVAGAVIALAPPVIASWLLIRFANLEKQKSSRFGIYVRKYMTRTMEMLRLLGYILMALGAWHHTPWIIALGFFMILGAWLRGLFFSQLIR